MIVGVLMCLVAIFPAISAQALVFFVFNNEIYGYENDSARPPELT